MHCTADNHGLLLGSCGTCMALLLLRHTPRAVVTQPCQPVARPCFQPAVAALRKQCNAATRRAVPAVQGAKFKTAFAMVKDGHTRRTRSLHLTHILAYSLVFTGVSAPCLTVNASQPAYLPTCLAARLPAC